MADQEPNDTPEPSPKRGITKENAAELGRRGGQRSGEVRRMKKDLTWLRQNSAELLDDLYNASQRQGSWRELPVEKAFDALKTCITYALGRPAAMKPNEDAPDDGTFDITEAPTEPD